MKPAENVVIGKHYWYPVRYGFNNGEAPCKYKRAKLRGIYEGYAKIGRTGCYASELVSGEDMLKVVGDNLKHLSVVDIRNYL